ncbi:MAG: NAD(P)H-dependent oxidoreductase [Oscillochloridaceae bacterium]|nr:NAD(P)H-dependent oxidoreductase [Chloroflexaceae bacterium]MDW8388843.1 NAD(P)H-dependent oxidoreductase [Oscillochloridaceae bacterium]
MHDGYLFTLGICGSANDGGPARQCLDAMLAALPPVKRAAYLGEVLVSADAPSFADPLAEPLLADIADAEVLLVVTPLPGGSLPPRLRGLFDALAAAPPPARRRFVALVAVGDGSMDGLWPLRHALEAVDAESIGELYADASTDLEELLAEAVRLARSAFSRAHFAHPHALI